MTTSKFILMGLLLAGLASAPVHGEGFGKLTGQLIYGKGKVARAPLVAVPPCGPVLDESLVVGPKGELANVVVSLFIKLGDAAPNAAPAVVAKLPKQVTCNNKGCRFDPHITVVVVPQQSLVLGNADPFPHNVKADCLKNNPFNFLVPGNGVMPLGAGQLTKRESLPVPVSCSIHPLMQGRLVVSDHPLVGISDEKGNFAIDGIPAGAQTFRFWQESMGYVVSVTQGGEKQVWQQGRKDVVIKAGATTDLGPITVW